MKIDRSSKLFAEAQQYLPGGVDSPVRAFRGVGGELFYKEIRELLSTHAEEGNILGPLAV